MAFIRDLSPKEKSAALGVSLVFLGLFLIDSALGTGSAFAGFEALSRRGPASAPTAISTISRNLGVILAIAITLSAMAVPLSANAYTPKLIDLFTADSVNRRVYLLFATSNGLALWTTWLVREGYPASAHIAACLFLNLVCIATVGGYSLYVFRFLLPNRIVRRLEDEIVRDIALAHEEPKLAVPARRRADRDVVCLATIALRSIDRLDRDTAVDAIHALRAIFDFHHARKASLPAAWLRAHAHEAEAAGLDPEALQEIDRDRTSFEHVIFEQLELVITASMGRLREVVSLVGAFCRHVAVVAAERKDLPVVDLSLVVFNTFIRRALQKREAEAVYKLFAQYRELAVRLLQLAPGRAQQVAFYLDYYGHQADRMGIPYIINTVAYDLGELAFSAFAKASPARDDILDTFIMLDRDREGLKDMPGIVKSQIVLAARLLHRGDKPSVDRIAFELSKVNRARLDQYFDELRRNTTRHYWELTDRRRHVDWVDEELRPALAEFDAMVRGVERARLAAPEPPAKAVESKRS